MNSEPNQDSSIEMTEPAIHGNARTPIYNVRWSGTFSATVVAKTVMRSFWRWMGVLGMVGWPIAILTVGGAWLGHYIDARFNSGIQFTLLLLTIGAVVSSLVAWKALGADR